MNEWMKASFDHKHARRDGSIHPAKFEFQARTERAFFEALLTEVGMPEADASSKAPAVVTVKTPRGIPAGRPADAHTNALEEVVRAAALRVPFPANPSSTDSDPEEPGSEREGRPCPHSPKFAPPPRAPCSRP